MQLTVRAQPAKTGPAQGTKVFAHGTISYAHFVERIREHGGIQVPFYMRNSSRSVAAIGLPLVL